MAGFNIDPNISLGIKPPASISIGDMLNIARGAQEYQQAAQVNPLKARQAAAEATRAEAESNVAEQTQEPRISTAKSTAGKAETEAKSALVGLSKDQLANMWAHTTGVVQQIQLMKDDPNLSIDAITERAKQLNENVGGDDKSLEQSLMGLPKGKDGKPPSKTELKSWLAQKEASMLSTQAHIEKIYQPPTMQSVGNKIVPVAQGNQLLTGQTPGMQIGQSNTVGLSPQVVPTVEGGVKVISGGGGAGTEGGGTRTTGAANANAQPNLTGTLQPPPGQTKETIQQQAKEGHDLFVNSVEMMTNPNSRNGYLPAQKQVTSNIINLLKDPTVDTGPITNYFSGKTSQESLTPKEQELAKYLEQRIQNLSPASQMDLASKHQAYGSINLKKDALMDLMRNEAGQITAKDLFNRGVIRAGGSAQNPDINAINNFKSKFALYANDPNLMKYISITGETSKAHLDKADHDELSKFLYGKSKEERGKLVLQKQQLMNLINGGQ